MDETLKSLRTVHATLVAVTAVIILVMITSHQAGRLEQALQEFKDAKTYRGANTLIARSMLWTKVYVHAH